MKLTEKSAEIFEAVKASRVSVAELTAITGRNAKSVGANINDLVKKGLVAREKEEVEGEDKPVTYVVLTEAGVDFVPTEE